MSCYIPMIEKLKSAISHKNNSLELEQSNISSRQSGGGQHSSITARDIQKIFPQENNPTLNQKNPEDNLLRADIAPKREVHGLTFTQNVGVFPRQVSLEIRHTHPALGLNEVAHQRTRHSQLQDNHFIQQCHYQNLQPSQQTQQHQPKGVLSLGLPPSMIPRGFATAKRPQLNQTQSATSEAIHHYYETLSPKYANILSMQQKQNQEQQNQQHQNELQKQWHKKKSRPIASQAVNNEISSATEHESDLSKELDMTLKTTDSGHGGSSVGSHSPSNPVSEISNTGRQQVTLLPNSGPPPRHLLPAKLRPSPAVKMHPPGVIFDFKEIADNASLSVEETGSSATESDSIGSLRNSSPENINTVASLTTLTGSSCSSKDLKHKGGVSSNAGRISSPSPRLNRLSPMVTGSATSAKLQKQILSNSASKHQDLGYHTLLNKHVATCSTSSLESSENGVGVGGTTLWDVRATKTPIRDLKIMTHNAKHSPISRSSTPKNLSVTFSSDSSEKTQSSAANGISFRNLPDSIVLKILSFLSANDLVKCSRISRRFYFLSWEPDLWESVVLDGDQRSDTDLALKTIFRLLSRNPAGRPGLSKLVLNGCTRLTDRGLAIVARTCPNLSRLEIQHCVNITSGGLMDLVTKCQMLDHLDVTGCHMISTIKVHQPPPTPNPTTRGATSSTLPLRRLDHLQYLDLTDCLSLEDSGLKMVVETCPQLLYLFLRRCTAITDTGIKYVASYCLQLRELSISDCSQITDFGLYELAKLGPNLRYLSVAKCDQISDAGVKQIARLCYKLRYLNVRGCEAVSDEAIEMLARSCSRLRSLDLGKCDVTDVGLKMLSENCPNLKKLSVKSCEMVSDRGIQCVAYYCRGLQQLNIQDCPITLEGYRMVKKFCKRCIIEHSHPGFF